MFGKIISLIIVLNINFMSCAEGDGVFKVPLEVREKNRPPRLVDDVNDPDMIRLKIIQDEFFSIVGNSSAGQEFKSFTQLLHLFDSKAGIELGKLLINGVMIGIGNKKSNQLLAEFWDDFQYRVTPHLTDAFVNYKDFISTIDLKMIPLTIQMLFQKDAMGNSLAQMPMGQLVDLIQPEASKYGIDVRNFIDGIIGKGDSTFPDIVRKLMNNFNVTTLMETVTKSLGGFSDITPPKKFEENMSKKKSNKDQTLMIFKPFVAKLLKENNIDLESEAVIQVLTPFITSWGQSLRGLIPSLQNAGKDFDFLQLLPLLNLFSQTTNGNKDKPEVYGTILKEMTSLAGELEKVTEIFQRKELGELFDLFKEFNNVPNSAKNKVIGNKNMDEISSLIQLGQRFLDNSAAGDLNFMSGLADDQTRGSYINSENIMQIASNLIEGFAKTSDESFKQSTDSKRGKTSQRRKIKYLPEALAHFLLRIQSDEKSHTKIKDSLAYVKHILTMKFGDTSQLKKQIIAALKPYKHNIEEDIDSVFLPFSFSQVERRDFWSHLGDDKFSENLISNTIEPVTKIILLVVSDQFQTKQNDLLRTKTGEILASFGVNEEVTLDNFPDRLKAIASMISIGWNLPVGVETLLEPLKSSLKETWIWYLENVNRLKSVQEKEFEPIIAESLKRDVAKPLTDIWKISEASKSSLNCLPGAVCQLTREVPSDHLLKLLITRLLSISFGGFKGSGEKNYALALQVIRAALVDGDCEKFFPISCPVDYRSVGANGPKEVGSEDDYEERFQNEFNPHQEL